MKDVKKLKLPDSYVDGRMPIYIEAADRLSNMLGDRAVIRGAGTGTFSIGAYLMGIQNFLTKIYENENNTAASVDEEALLDLLEFATQTLILFEAA